MAAHAAEECAEILREEAKELEGYLAALPPEAWTRPSACDRWQVGDVVAHLAGGAERQVEMISRGLQGDASLPPGFVPQDTATLSETNAQRDIGLRQSLGEQLLPTFTTQHEHLNRVLAGLSPQDWERPCWHPRRGAISVHAYAELRIQQLAMHGWDIRSSFLPPPQAHLNPRCTPILMGMVPPWLRMSFRPGPRLISPIRYRFEVFQTLVVTGPVSHSHDVVVDTPDAIATDSGGVSSCSMGIASVMVALLSPSMVR